MVEAMNELVQMTVTRSVVYYRDPKSPTTKYLVEQGFIEQMPAFAALDASEIPEGKIPYRLTQRGVDEANRYSEGQKATIEGENNE